MDAPAAGNSGLFDQMVPMGLSPPAAEDVESSSNNDPFADLLPAGMAALDNDDTVAAPKSAAAFPGMGSFGQFDEDVEEDDVTDDMLSD